MHLLRRFALIGFFSAFAVIAWTQDTKPAPDIPPPAPGLPVGWCILAKPEVFADAKAAGYEYVELAMQGVLPLSDEDFQKLVGQLQALNLRVLAGYNVVPRDLKLVGPEADGAKQDAHLKHVVARAAALKLTYVILNAGNSWRIPEGTMREDAVRQLADFGRRFAETAAREGITVLVEPLRSTDSNLLTTIDEAIALVDAVKHPNFQMMVDYSFLRIQKDDVNALLKAGRRLRHVHIANPDKNPRAYPMDAAESDYAPFFAVLKQIGYRGGISVHAGTKDFAGETPRAIAFLRTQARELAASPAPQALFNGKDFSGWKEPSPNLHWKIIDENLVVENDPGLTGSMLWTERSYRDFILEADLRWSGEIDTGFELRNPNIQLQVGISSSLKRDMTGSFYTGGKEKYPEAGQARDVAAVLKPGDWNSFRIEARGDTFTCWINGTQVSQYTDAKFSGAAPIGLQLHAKQKMKIEFRNLRVAELPE